MNQAASPSVNFKLIAWALLLPLVFFALHGMFSFDRAQYVNNAGVGTNVNVNASDSDTLLFRLERLAAYGTAVAAIALSLNGTLRLAGRHLFVFALPVLAILSTAWSQDRSKTLSLAVMALCLTLFAVYLCRRFRPDEQIELVNLAGILIALGCYFLILFVPSAGIRHQDASPAWQGLYVHKNLLGITTVYFFTAAYYAEKRTAIVSLFYKIYMLALIVLIVMSLSRTAWLQMLLLIFYIAFEELYIRAGKMEKVVLPLVAGIAGLLITIAVLTHTEEISLALGKSADMTGRTGIFQAIYPSLWKRPLTGFGYQAFWLGLHGESANIRLSPGLSALSNAENGILQTWLELGALGTVIILILLFVSVRKAIICLKANPTNFTRWNCSLVFLSLLMLINGDKFMHPDTIEWLFMILAYVNLAEEARHRKQEVVMTHAAPAEIGIARSSPALGIYTSP
jgi:exopolysaccharide production protein ExoQ